VHTPTVRAGLGGEVGRRGPEFPGRTAADFSDFVNDVCWRHLLVRVTNMCGTFRRRCNEVQVAFTA